MTPTMLKWSDFKQEQTPLATTTLVASPNQPDDDINRVVTGLTPSANIDIQSSMRSYATALGQLNQMNDVCTGKNVKTISDAIKLGESGPIQCGWYYNKGTGSLPLVNQAYLSTKQGPVVGLSIPPPQQPYTFYFGNNSGTSTKSLQAGQRQIEIDRCYTSSCAVATGREGCGYCAKDQKGIPIDANGKPKYQSAMCSDPVIISSSQCPATSVANGGNLSEAANANANANGTTSGVVIRTSDLPSVSSCMPESNGRFSGACLQSVLRDSGCGTRGSLSLALNGFSSDTNIGSLATKSAVIQKYGEINSRFLQDFVGASSRADAETQAKALADASKIALANAKINPTRQTKQNTLAIDLCTRRGYFLDNYNFCMELDAEPMRTIPAKGWDLVCLQKAWTDIGLWPQGTEYPSTKNIKTYNRLGTWSAVKAYMNKVYKEIYQGGDLVEPFAVRQSEYVSPPFMLKSNNFPSKYLTFKGPGAQLIIEDRNRANPTIQQFVWKKGSGEGTIRLVPVAATTHVLRHRGFSLHADTYYRRDTVLNNDSTFYVRPGNKDPTTNISFESINFLGSFLRHAGFRMWLHGKNGSALYNADSSFLAEDIKGTSLQQPFFTQPRSAASQVTYSADQQRYLGQRTSNRVGWGQELEPVLSNPSETGIELFKCTPANGITVITDYSTVQSFPTSTTGSERIFTLSSCITPTTQNIVPTIRMDGRNIFVYAVNSYLQTLSWPPNTLRDDDSNKYSAMKLLKLNNSSTKNFYSSKTITSGSQNPFTLQAKVPNILTSCIIIGRNPLPYTFTLNPAPPMSLVRDKYAPFLRFEVLQDSITNNKPIFTEIRCVSQMGGYINRSGPIQYFNKSSNVLKTPGINGYMQLSNSQVNMDYVDNNVWTCATFAFSLESIPSTTAANACTLLKVGNTINGAAAHGYTCAVYGSSNNNIKFVVQSLSRSGAVTNTSATIPIAINRWYMAAITNDALTLYKVDKQSTTVAGVIVWNPSIVIQPFNSATNTGPLLQIGAVNSAASLKVAWLHLFDTTITSIDTTAELIGYAPGGYETGVF